MLIRKINCFKHSQVFASVPLMNIIFSFLLCCSCEFYFSCYIIPNYCLRLCIRKLKAITKNDSASELLLVIATLASRKSTEEFKFGKRHTEEEIKNYLKGFYINAPVESVVIMSLDKEKKVIASDTVSDGTVNFSSVIPRQIIEKLAERGAEDFIMAHNHPGGVAEPSESDVVSTLNLATALEACGIHLKAHYVVAGGECNEIKFQEK